MTQSRFLVRRFAPLFATALLLGSSGLHAQDAAVVNANTVTVKVDNAQVRVLEAVLPPGAQEKPHSHPASVFYVIEGGRVRNHLPDGKTDEAELVAGQTTYRDATTHWAENVGTTTIRLIIVELKEHP
jgi:quercetin dioxygenase-like cupin family protein